MKVETILWDDAGRHVRAACADLWNLVWPGKTLAEREPLYVGLREHSVHIALDDDSVVAVARTFAQEVLVDGNAREVIALSSVCSDPARRGEGFGDGVVRSAFRHTTSSKPALFQTDVPTFYERFGSRSISNSISTTAPGAKPFDDKWVMIHPSDAVWDDEAPIDLTVAGW